MGAYIYKAKVINHPKLGKVGLYDFWYKPGYGYDKWEVKKETVASTFMDKHPEGVKYACIVPREWDGHLELYQVSDFMPVVVNDYSTHWSKTFTKQNHVGCLKGKKTGKKYVHFYKKDLT